MTSNNRSQRSSAELVSVAIRHYELGETIDNLASDLRVDQSTIRRWLSKARKDGIVQTLVVPTLDGEERVRLTQNVRYKYELEEVITVPGRTDVLEVSDDSAPKEAVVISIAHAAARYLESHLTNQDILLVPWGRMANYIVRQVKAPRNLPGLTVIPMEGVMGVEYDPSEANILASALASKFGGRSLLMPAPAVVDKKVGNLIEKLPLVKRVTKLYKEATVAIVPIAPADPNLSTVVRMGLVNLEIVEDLVGRGAVGEIASHWWFNSNGNIVNQEQTHAIGLGLDGLTDMVKRRAKVIAVVGAGKERIRPLKVALTSRLANILITDHVSAQLLLSEN
ncbi:hypothetical protein M1O55_04160 [Dehalococcoidia bacterium]|nr:hypothetical protein [Dehalococcoidia bacterium]